MDSWQSTLAILCAALACVLITRVIIRWSDRRSAAGAVPYGIERADHTFECVEATSMRVDAAGRLWLYIGGKTALVLEKDQWLYAERDLDEAGIEERG